VSDIENLRARVAEFERERDDAVRRSELLNRLKPDGYTLDWRHESEARRLTAERDAARAEVERLRALHDLAHAAKGEAEHAANVAREEVERLDLARRAVIAERDGARIAMHSQEQRALRAEAEVERLREWSALQRGLKVQTQEQLDETLAKVERLRETLRQVQSAMEATGQAPDGMPDPRRPLATAVWAALAGAPSERIIHLSRVPFVALCGADKRDQTTIESDDPSDTTCRPCRDRALAERVREACAVYLAKVCNDHGLEPDCLCSPADEVVRALDLDALMEP